MKVELAEHWGVNTAGEPVRIPQWYVVVDGKSWGYVGTHAGAKVCLIRRVSDKQLEEIEKRVAELLSREVQAVQPPEYHEQAEQGGDANDDDFDS